MSQDLVKKTRSPHKQEAVSNIAQLQETAAGQREAGHLRQLADVRVHERERHQVHLPLACKQTKVSIERMVVNTEHDNMVMISKMLLECVQTMKYILMHMHIVQKYISKQSPF